MLWEKDGVRISFWWHRPAELVAKFMDERLRGGQKGQSDEELDNTLDKALMLFRYIQVPLISSATCGASDRMQNYICRDTGQRLQRHLFAM